METLEQQDNQVSNSEPTPEAHVEEPQQPDLTAYFKEGEPGVFDADKVAELAKNLENQKKSTSYFQSQFMKKNNVPETVEGYYTNFRPDSAYAEALKDDKVAGNVKELFQWCLDNKIGEREAVLMVDNQLKAAVKNNILDLRTEEQLQADEQKELEKQMQEVQPMLDSLGRSLDENNEIIENFLNSKSVFTNNPQMKEFIENIADSSAMGYKFVTLLTQAVEHRGIPVVTGTSYGAKDRAAFDREYAAESDPVKREALAKRFFGEE